MYNADSRRTFSKEFIISEITLFLTATLGSKKEESGRVNYFGPGVDSASKINGYQEYIVGDKGGRCVGLTALQPSYADCLEILAASTSWNPKDQFRPV